MVSATELVPAVRCGLRELAVVDHDGNLVTFFEEPAAERLDG